MLTSRMFAFLAAASLAVCMSSCVPSDHPISDPDKSKPDPELYGTWIHQADGDKSRLVIGRDGKIDKLLKDVPAGIMSRGDENHTQMFFVTRIGRDRYWNDIAEMAGEQKVWDKRRIKKYGLYKYQVAGEKLTIWGGDEKALAREIENGKLRGEVQRNQDKSLNSARLTDATANLAKYLENGGGAVLFPDAAKMEYSRMPATQK